MRTIKTTSFLPALLCGAALLAFGCNQGEEHRAGQVDHAASAPTQIAQTPAPAPAPVSPAQINELQTPPQTVQVQPQTPPAAERADLDARERALTAREADLDTRERRLQQPKAQRPAATRPAPRPSPRVEETAPAPAPAPVPAAPEPAPSFDPAPAPEPAREEPRMVPVTVPAGTRLEVELTRTLASNTSSPGDAFRARVSEDVMQDGVVVIPRGSEILGEVTEAVPLKRVGGQARLALKLTDLVLPSGRTVPVQASFIQEGRNETRRDAATIGGATAGGAILGRILNKGDRSRGSIIGALIGAAAGTAIASKTPGEEVVIPEGSVVTLRLDDAVQVRVKAPR
jgi:type IV secretory pathway VirB10-like protein